MSLFKKMFIEFLEKVHIARMTGNGNEKSSTNHAMKVTIWQKETL